MKNNPISLITFACVCAIFANQLRPPQPNTAMANLLLAVALSACIVAMFMWRSR